MPFEDLHEFLDYLEKNEELKRVKVEVSPDLEVSEIANRVMKINGNALLFEKVKGSKIPLAMNLFGTWKRMCAVLGVEDPIKIGERIAKTMRPKIPETVMEAISLLKDFKKILGYPPKVVAKGKCKEIIIEKPNLGLLPIIKCWPKDGGKYITLPLVITKDPVTKVRNVGMYRMQVFDEKTCGMHWQIHKHGASHYRKFIEQSSTFRDSDSKKMEVAVALGCDPITIFSAVAPLPENVDEFMFAGFLREKRLNLVKCETIELEVPANAEIILEGYVDLNELKLEGPFGDHTGYYSLEDLYPVFHIICMTMRADAIYPSTIVGYPPMDDTQLGIAVERIFLPIIRLQFPEIVDINLPVHACFHNLAIVSIKKSYPGQAQKVMFGLWAMGQLMFTKIIVVVDNDVNVHDMNEVLWALTTRIDPKRDIILIDKAPADSLEFASNLPNLSSKMGIDATRKSKDEGFTGRWPEKTVMTDDIKKLVNKRWQEYGL